MNCLLSTKDLSAVLSQENVRVVDCSYSLYDSEFGYASYCKGHIAGACYAHLERDLSGTITSRTGRHPLPTTDNLISRLNELGIDEDSHVVAYDNGSGALAARLWWLLRWLGHIEVAVLDGGLNAWVADGGEVTAGQESYPLTRTFALDKGFDWVETEDVLTMVRQGTGLIIDAREAERFLGQKEPIDRLAGHIPGSVNRPFLKNLGIITNKI